MNNRNYWFLGIGILLLIAVFWLLNGKVDVVNVNDAESTPPENEAIDVAIDFYNDWLHALQSTTTDPYQLGLDKSAILAASVQEHISQNKEAELDPVLCQSEVPERVGAKPVFETADKAQFLLIARGKKSPEQAVVSLEVKGSEWIISQIECLNGEQAPVKEFTFERDGNLLKSVPAPLNSEYWHLVYTVDGQQGYAAPLFFDADSKCIAYDGSEGVCNPDIFVEADKASIKGQLTEAGVEVKILDLRK